MITIRVIKADGAHIVDYPDTPFGQDRADLMIETSMRAGYEVAPADPRHPGMITLRKKV